MSFKEKVGKFFNDYMDRWDARSLAREQGNIKRENVKQAELREKGNGYYFERIKSFLLAAIWFIPSVIVYAIHGRLPLEEYHEPDKGNNEPKSSDQENQNNKDNKDNEHNEPDKDNQEKEIVATLSLADGTMDFSVTKEMLKEPDIVEKIAMLNLIHEDLPLEAIMEENRTEEQIRQFDQDIFLNRLEASLAIGEIRISQGFISDKDNNAIIANFTHDGMHYDIIKNMNSGELFIQDENNNKISISNHEKATIYAWSKENNELLISNEEITECLKMGQEVEQQLGQQDLMHEADLEESIQEDVNHKESDNLDILNNPIEELGLSRKITNQLQEDGIKTIGELCNKTHDELFKLKGIGVHSIKDILNKTSELGLTFASEAQDVSEEHIIMEQELAAQDQMGNSISEQDADEFLNSFESENEEELSEEQEIDEEQSIIEEDKNIFGTPEAEELEQLEAGDEEEDLELD